ncbi:MAG TPA: hypothetical protein PLT97_10495, partial [Smithellaceae bacterium]|nr:hypothetical protein [Smithellaceae bacterium]
RYGRSFNRTGNSYCRRFIRELVALKVRDYLKAEDFYVLDDHLNDHGHIVVADLLYKTLKDKRIIRS